MTGRQGGVDVASHSREDCRGSGGQKGLSQEMNHLTKMLVEKKEQRCCLQINNAKFFQVL